MIPWEKIKEEYIRSYRPSRYFAEKYGLTPSAVRMRCAREGWVALREAHRERIEKEAEAFRRKGKDEAEAQMDEGTSDKSAHERTELMDGVSRKLMEKISLAIDQLDIQLVREVEKGKEMFYDHPQRTDKATKEIQTEREILREVKAPIDRNGIKLLAAALKDMKDVLMLRDPTDLLEQEAKIAKLQRDAKDELKDSPLIITFASDTEECCG